MPSNATGNVRVLVRVRPLNNAELTDYGSSGRSNVLAVEENGNGEIDFSGENKENGTSIFVNHALDSAKQFTFDAVHGESSTQEEVYNSVKGIVDAVVEGYNGTIVAYGQTGSGKTHTVFGSGVRGDHKGVGIVQRSLREIFSKFSQEKSVTHDNNQGSFSRTTFKGSFVEIFNERVYDLLSPDTLENNLQVRENVRGGGVYIEGLKEVDLLNTAEAEALLTAALANRHVASTNMNRTSSRSHAMFVLSVRTEHEDQDGLRKVRSSKFTLVDLAGSERQKSTGTTGNRLKEASMINKSLLCLGDVINKLVDREHGKSKHIPFRNSKLTFLLKDTWGGNSKTCLVATVSPSAYAQSETLSTLHFAQRAKLVKNNAVLNEDTCGTVAALQAELARLQSELKGKDTITETDILNEKETLSSLRRQNQRKEKKIDELKRDLEQERNLCHTLKRKLQEESFSRKLKERRLETVEKKNKDNDENEQIEMLKMEIKSLQKRLEAPSEDAIRWRVAYEEAQEALDEKKMRQEADDVDVSELFDRNSELEEALDRLLAEKSDLETKVADLTESSNETQQEIDSIMNEVDILEKEMHDLQDLLEKKNRECYEADSKLSLAQIEIDKLSLELDALKMTKVEFASKINELQTSLKLLSVDLEDANTSLKEKDEYLIEIKKSLDQKQLDFESKIEYLTKELTESNNSLREKDELISTLTLQIKDSLNESEDRNTVLKEALENLNIEKNRVAALNEKIDHILLQNKVQLERVNDQNKEENQVLLQELSEKDHKLVRLNEAIENQDAVIQNLKEEIDVFNRTLEEKNKAIQALEKISTESATEQKNLNDEITRLQHSLNEAAIDLDQKVMGLEEAKEEKLLLETKIAEIEQQMEREISESNSLRDNLRIALKEKATIQEELSSFLSNHYDVARETNELKMKVDEYESKMTKTTENYSSSINSLKKSFEEAQRLHVEDIDRIEQDKKRLEQEVQGKSFEIDRLINCLRLKDTEIEELSESCNSIRDKYMVEISEKQSQIDFLNRECTDAKKVIEETSGRLKAIILENQHLKTTTEKEMNKAKDDLMRSHVEQKLVLEESKFLKEKLDELSSVLNDRESVFNELCDLKSKFVSMEDAAKTAQKKLIEAHNSKQELDELYKVLLNRKEEEVLHFQLKISCLEVELSKTNASSSDLNSTIEKLSEEKQDLKFQLESLREHQNMTLEECRDFQHQIAALENENNDLKRIIHQMRSMSDEKSVFTESSSMLSTGSTWLSDNRLSYDNTIAECTDAPISTKKESIQQHPVAEELEESFDEEAFLPDDFLTNVEEAHHDEKEREQDNDPMSCSTPNKGGDYGKRRVPFSDRKNTMTPLRSTSKYGEKSSIKKKLQSTSKFLSSARKLMSSSKKSKAGDYMFINNKKLFEEYSSESHDQPRSTMNQTGRRVTRSMSASIN